MDWLIYIKRTVSILLLACLAARPAAAGYPDAVVKALEKAGANRGEIELALDHFSSAKDPLELEAAYFLVENMPGHDYTRFVVRNSSGAAVAFDPLAYPDYSAMVKAWDETEKKYGPMDWKVLDRSEDISSMTGAALIRNVELAFTAWRGKPWAAGVPFRDFLEYILPYRATNEPLEDWRGYFLEKYKDLPSRMKDPRDLIEAAALINDDIKKWFKFDPIFYRHPTDQGLAEMLKRGAGRCEDMTNLAIFALRANGIPVAGDYTPFWADTGNNHAWNALVLPDGRSVPFMGALENPGIYKLTNKPAKVYRGSFSRQSGSLAASLKAEEPLPKWFKSADYMDVTAAYAPVGNIEIKLEEPPAGASRTPYLAVFNSGNWEIIGWGAAWNGKARFENFAKGIAYLPVYYSSGAVIPAGEPFIYTSSGEVRALALSARTVTVTAASTTRRTIEHTTDNIAKSYLLPGRTYELYYWAGGRWRLAGALEAGGGPLAFAGVPAGALLWLKEKGSAGEERIFTYGPEGAVWW
jgi:hypothetical protein